MRTDLPQLKSPDFYIRESRRACCCSALGGDVKKFVAVNGNGVVESSDRKGELH
jgi:hypothetical protein